MGCASSTGSGADIDRPPSQASKQQHAASSASQSISKKTDNSFRASRSNGHGSHGYNLVDSQGGRSDVIPAAAAPSPKASQHQVVLTPQTSNGTSKAPPAPSPPPVVHTSAHKHHAQRGPGHHGHEHREDAAKGTKERRAAAGNDAVREQMRKMALGGAGAGKEALVSDSEDEDLAAEPELTSPEAKAAMQGWSKPVAITSAICDALRRNFVFKGISDSLLLEVVDRMYGVCFAAGSVVLQQDALPEPDDCMYFLQSGEAEVVITGAVDNEQSKAARSGEERKVEGHTVRIPQKPGWLFGDVALLFHSARTASVMARTNITVWALDRKTFLQFVMKHAQGARALRFLRKLPLLKGLSDNDLIRAASNMPQRTYKDGEALVKYGERGDELFLIRYGKVRVLRPDGQGGQVEAVVLKRGQFVGERAVINDRLRSADCVAQGEVQVVVLRKKDFLDLDNPLLAWMLDYDAISACLRALPLLRGLKPEQQETLMERFDAREELSHGAVLVEQGGVVDKLYICKIGQVQLFRDGTAVTDPSFVKESSGFSFFGDDALKEPYKSKYTIKVASDTLQLLSLPKRGLDSFLGNDQRLTSIDQVISSLLKCKPLAGLTDIDIRTALQVAGEAKYKPGDVIVSAGAPPPQVQLYLITAGQAVVTSDLQLPGQVDLGHLQERSRLVAGQIYGEEAITGTAPRTSLVAVSAATTVLTVPVTALQKQLAAKGDRGAGGVPTPVGGLGPKGVAFTDLEFHRVVGTGQFGLVRVVRNTKNNDVYALKVMHKAPITESKQVEHIINERRILQDADHPFCVRLLGAYQDRNSLYLLQEWVPGGELFHHLDIEGAFDEATAMFFAASVLLALESLHAKQIVYRDLKPENLLLDAQGYIKVADFGFAKFIGSGKTHTICGTPDYQAPEVIMRRGTTKAADYWALGVLIFEMLVGDPPFKSLTGDPWDTFRRTLSGRFYVPNFISDTAADLIFKLLQVNPDKRLGSGSAGAAEIKAHKWFSKLDWKALEDRKLPAPIKPRVRNPLDTSNFDNFDSCDVDAPPVPADRLEKHSQLWDLWDWIGDPPSTPKAGATGASG